MDNRISSINLSQNKYHTISIRNNLPKIPKYYQEQSVQDLPPKDYWVQRLAVPGNYEMQYNVTNGPCMCTSVLIHNFDEGII